MIQLNLNVYRNTHYQVLNQAKEVYGETVDLGAPELSPDGKFHLVYHLYPPHLNMDLGNVLPVVQKFTDDLLQARGFIKNDNLRHVVATDYRFIAVDKKNPRVELFVRPWEGP